MDGKQKGQNFGHQGSCVMLAEIVLTDVPQEIDQMGDVWQDDERFQVENDVVLWCKNAVKSDNRS